MYCWRVTKYNPELRDSTGAYRVDEWTSYSDIGKTYDGRVLSPIKYKEWEDRYVAAAIRFASHSSVTKLQIRGLEHHDPISDFSNFRPLTTELVEGETVSPGDYESIFRLILREAFWCRLEQAQYFYIHFGWDYYMYIGSQCPCPAAVNYATELGLFVEEKPSPYAAED